MSSLFFCSDKDTISPNYFHACSFTELYASLPRQQTGSHRTRRLFLSPNLSLFLSFPGCRLPFFHHFRCFSPQSCLLSQVQHFDLPPSRLSSSLLIPSPCTLLVSWHSALSLFSSPTCSSLSYLFFSLSELPLRPLTLSTHVSSFLLLLSLPPLYSFPQLPPSRFL